MGLPSWRCCWLCGSRRDIATWPSGLLADACFRRLIFVPLLLLTCDLLSLPIGLYGHHLQLSYGLSVQGWGSWFWDRAKMELVTLLLAVPLLSGFYALIRRSPARWWIYAWLAALPVLVFVVFVAPVVLDPLFNHFEPLEKTRPDLVSAIETVAQRGGLEIPRSRIYAMNASENSPLTTPMSPALQLPSALSCGIPRRGI